MKKRNAGFSLIELIVVIAIIAIASTGVVSAFLSLSGWRLKKAAVSIDNGIKKTRLLAMSREEDIKFVITCRDGKYYMQAGGEDETEIASGNITISYKDSEGTTATIDGSAQFVLKFVRSTGGFQPIGSNGGKDISCKEIVAAQGTNTRTIKLVPLTGETYIEN